MKSKLRIGRWIIYSWFILNHGLMANGQNVSLSVNTHFGQADNLFNSRLLQDQSVFEGSLSIAGQLSDYARVYGTFYRTDVLSSPDYSTRNLELGMQFRNIDQDINQWFAGIIVSSRYYSPTFDYYESSDLKAYVNWKYRYHFQGFIKIGYDLIGRSFSEVQTSSHTRHNVYASLNRSFNTGTSITLGSRLAVQDFWAYPVTSTQGRYRVVAIYDDLPSNYLTNITAQIGQSLGSHFGLTLRGTWQYRLNRNGTDFNVLDGYTNPFIDEFRWDGYTARAKLTYRARPGMTVSASLYAENRAYVDVPVYAYDFDLNTYIEVDDHYVILDEHRQDLTTGYRLEINKQWVWSRFPQLEGLVTMLTIEGRASESNDPLYQFSGNAVTIGIGLNY